jgi:hypothetical protein
MLTTKEWEFAIINQDEARKAQVHWMPGRRLAAELIPTAMRLGYTAAGIGPGVRNVSGTCQEPVRNHFPKNEIVF